MGITIYTASSCTPCQEIKKLLDEQKTPGVEVVDIESDEGFDRFTREVLASGDGAVPSAYRDGKRCAILVDDQTKAIAFDCDDPAPGAGDPVATPDPPADPPA